MKNGGASGATVICYAMIPSDPGARKIRAGASMSLISAFLGGVNG